VQALAFQESSAVRGAILSLGYCIGLGAPFIATGLFLDKSEKIRKVALKSGNSISKVGGVLLILIGILQLTGLWTDLMIEMRSWISDFVPVI
jgi:cytochrome c-type biogenesis protein